MPVAKVNGINIYNESHGKGDPLVLVMGMGGNMEAWRPHIPIYAKKFQVIALDNRGTGRSDKPEGPYSIPQFASDAVGLLDALGIAKAHFYGISMGGLIVQAIGLEYPTRVKSLILGCTTPGGPHAVPMSQDAIATIGRAAQLPPEEGMKLTLTLSYSQEFIDRNYDMLLERRKASNQYPTPPHAMKGHQEALNSYSSYDRLPQMSVPVLVIGGRKDRIIPCENSEILARRIPEAHLVVMENAGHGYTLEAKDEAAKVVLDFLRRHRN